MIKLVFTIENYARLDELFLSLCKKFSTLAGKFGSNNVTPYDVFISNGVSGSYTNSTLQLFANNIEQELAKTPVGSKSAFGNTANAAKIQGLNEWFEYLDHIIARNKYEVQLARDYAKNSKDRADKIAVLKGIKTEKEIEGLKGLTSGKLDQMITELEEAEA